MSSSSFPRVAAAMLLIMALVASSIVAASAGSSSSAKHRGHSNDGPLVRPKVNHIYPIDHWSYVTKMTNANFDDVVKEALDNGRTLMVRWIASPACGPCAVQAKAWDRAVRRYKDDENVVFADVNIQEFPDLANRAGVAQQPTIRAYTKVTGPNGMQYNAKAPHKFKSISEELTNDHYMIAYIEDARRQSLPCQLDGTNCDDSSGKSRAYLSLVWSKLSPGRQVDERLRLESLIERKNLGGDIVSWANQRIRLLKLAAEKGPNFLGDDIMTEL